MLVVNETALEQLRSLTDFPTLQRFASILWKEDNSFHGAAVMVGAGFSRGAATSGDKGRKLPLWNDFSRTLSNQLGTSGSDPLRIAEEYSAYFGRQALNDLIKKEINDAAWQPGELYKSLLTLPWTEVLTTNWDTLLERASDDIHERMYSKVYRQEDLSNACSPRIVKLHGTINVNDNLTFTQEDYRRYPQDNAAFVNFARQVFIENELCLIGVSGDDPNFLQWTGWVRDHLATSARRIYIVGVLELSAAKRKYLESINIAPIDLASLVSSYDDIDLKHQKATEIFLTALNELKPKPIWKWRVPRVDHQAEICEKLFVLKQAREEYPGWLVCPSHIRTDYYSQCFDKEYANKEALDDLKEDIKIELLYELAWRSKVTSYVLPIWLANEMLKISSPSTPNILSKKQQLEIAIVVLNNCRWFEQSDSSAFEEQIIDIIENNSAHWSESQLEVVFYKADRALRYHKYDELETLINNIVAVEPMQKLRMAIFLGELGKYQEGKELIASAYKTLMNQYRNNLNSIFIISRLAVATYIFRGVNRKSSPNINASSERQNHCDIGQYIVQLKEKIRKEIDRTSESKSIQLRFEPGTYKDNSETQYFSNDTHPFVLFNDLSYIAGIPVKWHGVNFLGDVASQLISYDDLDINERFPLAVRYANSESDGVIEQVFSRYKVACITKEESTNLFSQCEGAIKYWLDRISNVSGKRNHSALTRLRVFIEVLARLSVRASSAKAHELFNLAIDLGCKKEMQDHRLFDSLSNLLNFSLKSIPKSEHHILLEKSLNFPLAKELSNDVRSYSWANPIIEDVGIRNEDKGIDQAISNLIGKMEVNSPATSGALLRIIPLIDGEYLTKTELDRVEEKIWGNNPTFDALPDTGLLHWILLKLPASEKDTVTDLVSKYIFKIEERDLFDTDRLYNLCSSANCLSVFPEESEAIILFNTFLKWKENSPHELSIGLLRDSEHHIKTLISESISRSIVPALGSDDLNEANFERLHKFYLKNQMPELLIAFPYFSVLSEEIKQIIEELIRKGLFDSNSHLVRQASFAILRWSKLNACDSVERLTKTLVDIIRHTQTPALAALVHTANELLQSGKFGNNAIKELAESIPRVFDRANYNSSTRSDFENVSISLLRAECVILAENLQKNHTGQSSQLERIINESKLDPLPEVRFAIA
ncbi:SIR2 family protein [Vibrio sp. 10N.222.54.E8]|uniref:SIR2 family NAD-dependent protein deacylase n=1 Tax=Vibrio sp. 10N.222.54.E8 TaxID=3229643 RepID=UPI00354B7160